MKEHNHSIYTHCWICYQWGVNFPNDKVCENCGSTETTTYYPEECLEDPVDKKA